MSLIHDHTEIINALRRASDKAARQQHIYFALITGMVALHQKHRLAKNYYVSDEIRSELNKVGVRIIQGTAKYKNYDDIPDSMKNVPVNDTWTIE